MASIQNKKILVVEDDPDIRTMLGYILKDEYTIVLCENGRSGIAKALTERPDLILLDIYMPGLSGLEVCRTVRNTPEISETPIIILSAGAQKDEVSEGYALGANDYVFKPFDPDVLLERIEKLI